MNSHAKEGNEEEFGQSNTPATPPRKKRSKAPMKKKGYNGRSFQWKAMTKNKFRSFS